MLPSAQRLRRSSDFSQVLRSGRRAASGRVVAHVNVHPVGDERPGQAPETITDPSRVGLIVSKAVGGSVQRNLVKRRLRAAAREHLTGEPSVDIVLRALPGAAQRPYRELAADVDRAITKSRRAASGQRS